MDNTERKPVCIIAKENDELTGFTLDIRGDIVRIAEILGRIVGDIGNRLPPPVRLIFQKTMIEAYTKEAHKDDKTAGVAGDS